MTLSWRALPSAVALAAGLGGCADWVGHDLTGDDLTTDEGVELADDAVIEYQYLNYDGRVDPEIHTNYLLTVDSEQVHAAVLDDERQVVRDVTAPLPPEVWQHLALSLDDVETLDVLDVNDNDIWLACQVSETRHLIHVRLGEETVLYIDVRVCAGNNLVAAGGLDAYMQPVRDAVPDWDALIS